jgi:hypothetical protein
MVATSQMRHPCSDEFTRVLVTVGGVQQKSTSPPLEGDFSGDFTVRRPSNPLPAREYSSVKKLEH